MQPGDPAAGAGAGGERYRAEPGGEGGDATNNAGGQPSQGDEGQTGGEAAAGAASTPPVDECAVDGEVLLEAPIATTSLSYVAPLGIALGQGFSSQLREEGVPLSEGCVTGKEVNASSLNLGGGVVSSGGGTRSLGVFSSPAPIVLSVAPRDAMAPFQEKLDQDGDRSAYAYHNLSSRLWQYFMLNEARSAKSDCGAAFVRSAAPSRSMAVVFKITLPTTEERKQFSRCLSYPNDDLLALDDPTPASRYLVAHHAALAIHVFRAAGVAEESQKILDETECSAANLPACAVTLNALEAQQASLLVTPSDTLQLAQLAPDWGVFDFGVSSYSVLPD